ncbi:MAG TPA: hypothetical protein VMU65_11780 [Candidatus Saccharimonadales bacterium]|nr:hypothetical protein [Candidatus Saccharimonadales bacterium]
MTARPRQSRRVAGALAIAAAHAALGTPRNPAQPAVWLWAVGAWTPA